MGHARFLPPGDNFLALSEDQSNPDCAHVVIVPVPFEATSTYGRGSAGGPAAILRASREVELFDAALGFAPHSSAGGIATRVPLDTAGLDGAALAGLLRQEVGDWLGGGRFVTVLGGEHTSVVGSIQAHCSAYDALTVLQLDAHSDLRPQYLDDVWNHACAMARVLDFHDHVVQVGIRSQAEEERTASEGRGIPVFYAHEIHRRAECHEDWVQGVIDALRPNVYITLDCDVMDPSVVPATGAPEPGGLTWQQITVLLERLCAGRNVVGFDVNELAPVDGSHHAEFTVAKLVYRLLGYRFRPGADP
jgi:agmatinase